MKDLLYALFFDSDFFAACVIMTLVLLFLCSAVGFIEAVKKEMDKIDDDE